MICEFRTRTFFILYLKDVCYYSFVDPETQACSARELLLIVGFPVIIKLVITSALLGNLFVLHNNR